MALTVGEFADAKQLYALHKQECWYETLKDSREAHLGHNVIDVRYKAASVPQCVLVRDAPTDKLCVCFIVSRCSQVCWGKDLQSALTFLC